MKYLLFIEDDKEYADMLSRRLHKLGDVIPVVKAHTLKDGIANVSDAMLVILDLSLPDSGIEQTIRDGISKLAKHAPVCVLTGHPDTAALDSQVLSRCIENGADMACFKSDLRGDASDFFLLMLLQTIERRERLISLKAETN